MVGGGLGDIEEVLLAGRILAATPGCRLRLFRGPGRPLPPTVEGPWDWPPLERVDRPRPGSTRALTISAEWGVAAAPARPERYGRAGPWSVESEALERAYGPGSVLHVSFEEFARTLTSREETRERFREGGLPTRRIPARLGAEPGRREMTEFHDAYRKFRGFDRPNLLTLFATFDPSVPFGREYPEAIQTGPLWPGRPPGRARSPRRSQEWLWYASPSSSTALIPSIDRALSTLERPPRIRVRSPRPILLPSARDRWTALPPERPAAWTGRFRGADLRIVTGSRTLLEALELGGPFLYFNGVTGRGRARRRHRPEKIGALLRAWRTGGIDRTVLRELGAFASGRDIEAVVRRAATDPSFARGFPRGWKPRGFRTPFDDAGRLLRLVALRWATGTESVEELSEQLRSEGRRAIGLR